MGKGELERGQRAMAAQEVSESQRGTGRWELVE